MNAVEVTAEIARTIQRVRKERGLSQAQLGVYSGISPGTVASMESGRLGRYSNLEKVLNYLGIELRFGYEEEVNSE